MNNHRLAMENDNRIMNCAYYQETRGLTKKLASSHQLMDRFAYFKQLVMRGSMTLNQLEDKVFSEHGIMENRQAVGFLETFEAIHNLKATQNHMPPKDFLGDKNFPPKSS